MLFPTFSQDYCYQTDRRGKRHKVRLLPIGLLDNYFAILEDAKDAEAIATARGELRELALQTLPAEFKADLMYLGFADMVTLINELFFGNEVTEKEKNNSKTLDFEFLSAILMNVYHYKLEEVLNLSMPVFMKLLEMSPRVKADNGLFEIMPSVSSAVNGGESMSILNNQHGSYYLADERETIFTAQAIAEATARLEKPQKTIKAVKLGDYL